MAYFNNTKLQIVIISFVFIYQIRRGSCVSPNQTNSPSVSAKSQKSESNINTDDDLQASASNEFHQPLYVQPLAFGFGAALQAEIRRLKSVEEVFPPNNLSFYKPYADRTVALLKFPVISPNAFIFATKDKNGQSPMTNCTYTLLHDHYYHHNHHHDPHDHYHSSEADGPPPSYGASPAAPEYGAPPVYGPSPPIQVLKYGRIPNPAPEELRNEVKPPPDVGVIVAQSYILRENVRDYLNLTGFNNGKPSSELLFEMAQALGKKNFESMPNPKFNPPLNPFYYLYTKGFQVTQGPSFVLLHLESYLKSSNTSRKFGFIDGKSYSNGTIYFPREKNPELMVTIPFVLRTNGEIDYILDSEGNYHGHQDFGTLLKAKSEIKSFVKLVHEVHGEVHMDGKVAVERALKTSENLDKPRFVNTTADDPRMAQREAEARLNSWLYTSSIGIRSITYPKFFLTKEYVLVDPLDPLVKLHPFLSPADLEGAMDKE